MLLLDQRCETASFWTRQAVFNKGLFYDLEQILCIMLCIIGFRTHHVALIVRLPLFGTRMRGMNATGTEPEEDDGTTVPAGYRDPNTEAEEPTISYPDKSDAKQLASTASLSRQHDSRGTSSGPLGTMQPAGSDTAEAVDDALPVRFLR